MSDHKVTLVIEGLTAYAVCKTCGDVSHREAMPNAPMQLVHWSTHHHEPVMIPEPVVATGVIPRGEQP